MSNVGSKEYVVIDIGTSETRVCTESGKALRVPNNCVRLTNATDSTFPGGDSVLDSLEVCIKGYGEEDVHLLYGKMAERYSKTTERPSPLSAKHTQELNHYSIIVGAALARAELGNKASDLYLALPPVEVRKARKKLAGMLGGDYIVELPKLNKSIRVKFTNVYCFEESRMSAEAFMVQLSEDHKSGRVLSVDIGAGTTDLAIYDNGVFLEKSAKSYRIGGNTAREYLIESIASEYDCDLSVSDAEEVMTTGLMKSGNTKVDVVELVNEAKEEFAEELLAKISEYFKAVGIAMQTVNAFLVSGGGALAGTARGMNTTVSYVVSELNKVCAGIDTVEYQGDTRLANLAGLRLQAESDYAKSVGKVEVTPLHVTSAEKSKQDIECRPTVEVTDIKLEEIN